MKLLRSWGTELIGSALDRMENWGFIAKESKRIVESTLSHILPALWSGDNTAPQLAVSEINI